jgi:hypothetical protein
MTRKTIVISGGLGNQLFQFSFAHYLVKEFNARISLYAPFPKNGGRDFKLQSLCANCNHIDFVRTKRSWRIDTTFKFLDFVNNNNFNGWLSRLIEKYVHVERNAYISEEVKSSARLYSGYFQHWYYVAQSQSLFDCELNGIVTGSESMGVRSSYNGDYGVVHFRRGDLINFRSSMGLLKDAYFIKAIEIARAELNPAIRLVVLSDDKSAAVKVFSGITEEIFGPSDIEEWEALNVMSTARFVITSNSTFSWWGAFLCFQNGGEAYLPSPWFLNWSPDPRNAFHFPGFKVIPSDFS